MDRSNLNKILALIPNDTNLGRLAPKPVLYQPGSQLSSSSNGKTSTPNQPVVRNLGISEDATIGDGIPIDKSN